MVATEIAAKLAEKSFSLLLDRAITVALSAFLLEKKESVDSFKNDINGYMGSTFEKCSKVKTIINSGHPASLLEVFVNLDFKSGNRKLVDIYDLVEKIKKGGKYAITGTGGGGKTFAMKYIWLSLFVESEERIPIFLELRRLNDVSKASLITVLHRNLVGSGSSMSESVFASGLKEGRFVLVLDGFDEISDDKKLEVERDIVELAANYSQCCVVVSGRHDPRFGSWQAFEEFSVNPLNKNQCLELINNIDFDRSVKRNFTRRIRSGLFESHQTFLEIPLLCTMMLLSFSQNADVPDRMHLFYDQAFTALLVWHDATKESFSRKRKCDLDPDDFKRVLSYFCLVSYIDRQYEFSETSVLNIAKKAIAIENFPIKASDFVQDLVESVCILQQDGLVKTFVHRSFQEYFSAYCLVYIIPEKIFDVINGLSLNYDEKILPLAYGMNAERIEGSYFFRYFDEVSGEIRNIVELRSIQHLYNWLKLEVHTYVRSNGSDIESTTIVEGVSFSYVDSHASFLNNIDAVYRSQGERLLNRIFSAVADQAIRHPPVGKSGRPRRRGPTMRSTRILFDDGHRVEGAAPDRLNINKDDESKILNSLQECIDIMEQAMAKNRRRNHRLDTLFSTSEKKA